MMIDFIKSNRFLLQFFAAVCVFNSAQAEDRLPNIIFILTDDLGYSDVSCYGSKRVKTPHIDKLAASGAKFTHFHTASSICSPSRAAFLTGAYPQRNGLYMGINQNRAAHWFLGLNPDEITLAEQFKKQNYQTLMIGKWHLGSQPEFHPYKHGFDSYYGMPSNAGHLPAFYDGTELIYEETPLDQLTALYTERAVQLIKEERDQPFFLYFAHNYPHVPYKAGVDFKGSSKDGVRGDVMQEMDWGIGQMMQALSDAGIADNTIVIFSSDNGSEKPVYNKPYAGSKYTTLEGGHRVPFIVNWPAKIEQGLEFSIPVNAMDLFPTLSEAVGEPLATDRVYDGVSLLPLFEDKELVRSEDKPYYYYNCDNLQALRYQNWKLHLPRKKSEIPWWDRNKKFLNIKKPVLYNLKNDEAERKDVSVKYPEVMAKMLKMAEEARQKLGDYNDRGDEQRAVGSVVDDAPIVGNHKTDWEKVDEAVRAKIQAEWEIREPVKSKAIHEPKPKTGKKK